MTKHIDDLSDDELMNLSAEEIAALSDVKADSHDSAGKDDEDEPQPAKQPQAPVVDDNKDDDAGNEDEKSDQTQPSDTSTNTEDADKADEKDPEDQSKAEKQPEANTDAAKKTKPAKVEEKKEPTSVDYESAYKKIFAPFKANGRDMQAQSPEEVIRLMEMGANYNKKMSAMKPHLQTMRMLENAGITQEHLNFLIDVHNKVPAAVNKLVKDSGIDPMDLSAEKATGYTPGNHAPSDAEVELDVVLNDLDDSKSLPRTIQIVSKEWDAASRRTVAQNPSVIRAINDHIESGVYDQVSAEVERQRTFGKLSGLSDLEAYRQVGDAMHASGAFEQAGTSNTATTQSPQTNPAPAVVEPKPKQADEDSKRKDQKRAAMPAKSAAPAASKNADFNPLSMSDEEFAKFKPT
jgi:hypothetical protein